MSSPVSVRIVHRFQTSPQRLFDAWLTPTQAARFLFRTRTGNVMQCEINPVVGGGFLVTDRRPVADGDESVFDVVHRGRYVEIDRPRRLAFELTVLPLQETPSRVTVTVKEAGTNQCDFMLVHDLGDTEEARCMEEITRKGWLTMLALLERELFPRRVTVTG